MFTKEKILISIAAVVIVAIVVYIASKKIGQGIVGVVENNDFLRDNKLVESSESTLTDKQAKTYAQRVMNDLSYFDWDFSIYSDLLLLTNDDIIKVNNAYLEYFAYEYDYKYFNLGMLIESENFDKEFVVYDFLARFSGIVPTFIYD